jgi:hypothetical protein
VLKRQSFFSYNCLFQELLKANYSKEIDLVSGFVYYTKLLSLPDLLTATNSVELDEILYFNKPVWFSFLLYIDY